MHTDGQYDFSSMAIAMNKQATIALMRITMVMVISN